MLKLGAKQYNTDLSRFRLYVCFVLRMNKVLFYMFNKLICTINFDVQRCKKVMVTYDDTLFSSLLRKFSPKKIDILLISKTFHYPLPPLPPRHFSCSLCQKMFTMHTLRHSTVSAGFITKIMVFIKRECFGLKTLVVLAI